MFRFEAIYDRLAEFQKIPDKEQAAAIMKTVAQSVSSGPG
jgi:hypothetical protein